MITLDQARIDAPKFPRDQAWWDGFMPTWLIAAVHDDNRVTFTRNPAQWWNGEPVPPNVMRQEDRHIRSWLPQRLAVAIVD